MKTTFQFIIILFIAASVGCKGYSKYTIDEKPMVKIDTNLLGIWKTLEDTSKANFIVIQNYSDVFGFQKLSTTTGNQNYLDRAWSSKDFTYYITYMDMHGRNPHFQQWSVFPSVINNEKFLNIDYHYTPYVDGKFIREKDEDGFFFARLLNVSKTNDIMTTCVVADPNMIHLQNSTQVRSRIVAYFNKPYFYSDTMHWYRVSKYHASLRGSSDIANR